MTVLISIDTSESSRIIFEESLPYLRGIPEAEIHIITVLDLASIAVSHQAANSLILDTMEKRAAAASAIATEVFGARPFTFSKVIGDPADEILQKVQEIDCDLLIMGTHGRTGLNHLLMGSVAEKMLRLSHCNTLVIPTENRKQKSSAV